MARDREMEEDFGRKMAKLNAKGQEILDPVPMAPPVGYKAGMTSEEMMINMIRGEHMRLRALEAGDETFEQADDFDIDDDVDPDSPYEDDFDPVETETRMRLRQQEFDARVRSRLEELGVKEENDDGRTVEGTRGDSSRRDGDDPGGAGQSKAGNEVKPVADQKPGS